MRTVSVSTALFDGYPLEQGIGEIARAGGKWVEPAFIRGYVDFDETAFSPEKGQALRRLIEGEGVGALAVSAHMDLALPDAVEMLTRRIEFVQSLGAKILITNAGQQKFRALIAAAIEEVLPLCEEAGVTLALENPGHGSGDLISNGVDGAALVEALGSERVRLNYDAGNIFTYSHEAKRPESDLEAALPFVAHLHLKDVASDGPDWRFTALGQGAIDYPALWQKLPKNLPVGIELPLRLERPGRADPRRKPAPLPLDVLRAALRRSLDFVAALDGRSG
ncbi:MAG TPA: sugar phosphate isomerase/epimerase family protein [Mesorhizobium sp.]|jgi:sugar phosphate isomerase/epimerase|nr:sugar phosphate isomerase/epimerase family protein [Mesorhizobium sp.]